MAGLRPSLQTLRDELKLDSPASGPKGTRSLRHRGADLAAPAAQLRLLEALPLINGDFDASLAACGAGTLRPAALEILQINVGRLCNMTCRHCHVDAGPDRVLENMDRETIALCLAALDRSTAHTVDITGGAPELNPHFRYLVDQCVTRGKHVIDRCNLSILLVPRFADLPLWLAERRVEIACSLPHYRRANTDRQRGEGAFERSVEALRRLNAAGYGRGDPDRRLTLMSKTGGAYLAGPQASMEREWKAALARDHGVTFDRLFTLNNMPISRFLDWLVETNNLQPYMETLAERFNPSAVPRLMCRNTLSVSWDGTLYDCDFNQMLDLPLDLPGDRRAHIRDFDPEAVRARRIRTARHCFGCTAGPGSSCGGATT